MKVKYFSESGYTHLFDSISKHADLYGSSPNCDWIKKEFVKAVYCHPVYLTYMQSTS